MCRTDMIRDAHVKALRHENRALKAKVSDLEYTVDRMGAVIEAQTAGMETITDLCELVGGE